MEPKKQVEIQLGHLCNNRCVFCVSGQETAFGNAKPLEVAPIAREIEAAYAAGYRKITLLGGEPTLQPGFLDVVRRAVALGFEEIVLFTNGVKTARGAFIDEILATGGNFTFRISLQGANAEAHDRTTKKPGSFARIERTLTELKARKQRITVNMCVVRSNFESVDEFPSKLLPYGVTQLHLDMVRPMDAGRRTEEELRAMIPRYSDMVPALERMVRGFPEGFDVNIGNLPYCVAPSLAHVIHHDGEATATIAVDGGDKLSKPWDKYLVKRRDKVKPDACSRCVFENRCSGVFETYREFYGTSELAPITAADLARIDPQRRFFSLHMRPVVAKALASHARDLSGARAWEAGDLEIRLDVPTAAATLKLALRPASDDDAIAKTDAYSMHVVEAPSDHEAATSSIEAIWRALLEASGARAVHPPASDAVGAACRSVAARLRALRRAAPFGELVWESARVMEGGSRAEIVLSSAEGHRATVWLADTAGRPSGGYRVDAASPGRAMIDGLGGVLRALRIGSQRALESRRDV